MVIGVAFKPLRSFREMAEALNFVEHALPVWTCVPGFARLLANVEQRDVELRNV